MKEKKRTRINVTALFKKALEENGFTVELYSDKFNPEKKGDKLLTIGFLPRALVDEIFYYGKMLDYSVVSVQDDSINMLHQTEKESEMPHIAVYSHKTDVEGENPIDKYGPVIVVAQEGMDYQTEKDGLRFSLFAPKRLKYAEGYEDWHDFIFKMEYYVNKDVKKIIDIETDKLKKEILKMLEEESLKKREVKKQ